MRFSLSPKRNALQFLEGIQDRHTVEDGLVVVAWARLTGVKLLHKALGDTLRNVTALVGVSEGHTSAEAVHALLMTCKSVHIFDDAAALIFHPKVYLFANDEKSPTHASVQVGSSNLTGGGLVTNYEGNIEFYLAPAQKAAEKQFLETMKADLRELWETEFCQKIDSAADIESLVDKGILRSERILRRKDVSGGENGKGSGGRKKSKKAAIPQHDLPFKVPDYGPLDREDDEDPGTAKPAPGPGGGPFVPGAPKEYVGAVFVRTLTGTDIGKLNGDKGTLEPDLTVTARDTEPGFWGWPDMFEETTHKLPRLQWETRAILRTSEDPASKSAEVTFRQWFRDKREGHAAEHRFQISPVGTFRDIAPNGFDANSLIAIRRRSDEDIPFEIFFVLPTEPNYGRFSAIASHQRPQHRFGYELPVIAV